MEMKCSTMEMNGKAIRLFETSYKGIKQTFPTVRQALLYAHGYGADQAADLRYQMKVRVDE